MNLFDFYPDKAQYRSGDIISLIFEHGGEVKGGKIHLNIIHLDKIILELDKTVTEKKVIFSFNLDKDFAGFGAELTIYMPNGTIESISTAFDIAEKSKEIIRYGFLSDFDSCNKEENDVSWMEKFHINVVQFYDWSYCHDNFVTNRDLYTDMMGKQIDIKVVRKKIDTCHTFNMKALGYGAVYAASKQFFNQHPDWSLYTSAGEPLIFINTFFIMNINKTCPWHDYIIDEYKKAVSIIGFDGIHMDTYGFPKTAFSIERKKINLDDEYPILIEDTKNALNKLKQETYLIFNNVGNWPVKSVAMTPQNAVYIEVWEPYTRYAHLKQIIIDAKNACQNSKTVILAAYLAPFRTDTPKRALNAARLLLATCAANGATNLLIGEHQAILTQGYYVDYSQMNDQQAYILRNYFDFIVRYEELLFNQTLKDISFTHIGWDNTEYSCSSKNWSSDGQPNKLWINIKENQNTKIIHLINLCGCIDDLWNFGKDTPLVQKNISFKVQIDSIPRGIFYASPDETNTMIKLPYYLSKTNRGIVVEFSIQYIKFWGMVYIDLTPEKGFIRLGNNEF